MLVDYILLYVKKKRSVGCGKTKLRRPWSLREDERIELEVDRVGRSFLRGKKKKRENKKYGEIWSYFKTTVASHDGELFRFYQPERPTEQRDISQQ